MLTKREAASESRPIWQKATTAFDGTQPKVDGEVIDSPFVDGIYKYGNAAAGGLIWWDAAREPVVVPVILVTLANAGNIDLYQVNLDANGDPLTGEAFQLEHLTGVTHMRLTKYETVLLPRQALKLITTQPGIVIAYASLERTFH